jgi:DNA-binding response OmpR family regulator
MGIDGHNGARVLVLDDDPAILRMLRLALASGGCHVETAEDGIAGLEAMDDAGFDVVVLDLQMPRMDGRSFYKELRARGDHTPVLILSAYGAEEAADQLGADASMSKPFDPDELLITVHRLARAGNGARV